MRLSRVSAAIKIPDSLKPAARFVKGIRQAKAEGGTLPSVRGPLRRLMRDSYIRYGDFVGEDSRGKFVQIRKQRQGKVLVIDNILRSIFIFCILIEEIGRIRRG